MKINKNMHIEEFFSFAFYHFSVVLSRNILLVFLMHCFGTEDEPSRFQLFQLPSRYSYASQYLVICRLKP